MLFEINELEAADEFILDEISNLRTERSAYVSTTPRRWAGYLRQMSFARAVQGSNWIEGYRASLDDVLDTIDHERFGPPSETSLALSGYRDAMTYILQLAKEKVELDHSAIKAIHFMMMNYDMDISPGQYRTRDVWVEDQEGNHVYDGPDSELVQGLMAELVESIREEDKYPAMVQAAMAHLNVVMIHPFRDGNGRMARALQTLILSREGSMSPVFSSIEEYLGRNTHAYYQVLAEVGQGSWNPKRSVRPWIRFSLTAHYRQARTLKRRIYETEQLYDAVEQEVNKSKLSSRAVGPLADASRGRRLRRMTYINLAGLSSGEEVSEVSASRDLRTGVKEGLLEPVGEGRGRTYVGTKRLRSLWAKIRGQRPSRSEDDPYETFKQQPIPGLRT